MLSLFLLLQSAQLLSAGDPVRVVSQATRAVEGDSARTVVSRWEARLARNPDDRAALLGLGTIARLRYDYSGAALQFARLFPGDDKPGDRYAVYALLGQGTALRTRGQVASAEQALVRAFAEAEKVRDSSAMAEALVLLSATRARTAGVAAAESLLAKAASLIPRGNDRIVASLHCVRAQLYSGAPQQNPLAEARIGAELADRAGEPRTWAACNHAMAADFMRRGRPDSALAHWAMAEAAQRRTRDRAGLAATLQWRGSAWSELGYYGNARRDLEAAVSEGQASGNESAVAWALLNFGVISLTVGDLAAGQRSAIEAFGLMETQGDQWGLASVRALKGGFAMAAGNRTEARAAYQEALNHLTRTGQTVAQVITLHIQLALLAIAGRDWSAAEQLIGAARRFADEQGARGWGSELQRASGLLALRRGDLESASSEFRRALALLDPSEHTFRYQTRALLAEVYAHASDLPNAEAELGAAADELDRWRATLDDRALRLQAFELNANRLDPDLGIATVLAALARGGRVPEAFLLAEQRRARELLDRLARNASLRVRKELDREGIEPKRRAAGGTTVEELQKALPDDRTALLEYVTGRGGEPTTLFVVTRTGVRTHVLVPIDSVSAAIERFALLIETGVLPSDLARALGTQLLSPAVSGLPPDIERLVIVPDDVLHRVPFDALLLADGRFVIERFAISIAPSAAVARHLWQTPARVGAARVLALADPDLSGGTRKTEGALPRLAASGREARAVARFAGNAEVRLRRDASEAWFRRATLDQYSVIHLATHAEVDDRSITRTALMLSPGEGDDGLLLPGDLAALKLDADLVVLSACGTAGGVVVRGEGVLGLVAPLLEAGARSVVATQWRIADGPTVRLVEQFYQNLASGLRVSDALRKTKLESLRRHAPVNEWAAFTIIGDPAVLVSLR